MGSIYIPKFKKKAYQENGIIIYEDEASFRQNSTLHQTWAPIAKQPVVPTKGQRNSQKVFGAVAPQTAECIFKMQKEYFNHDTYISFLEDNVLPKYWRKGKGRIYLIQDNATYHKKSETYDWFSKKRKYIEVQCLPPYHPELNAAEKLWWYTRKEVTHNRYFAEEKELQGSLRKTFLKIEKNPIAVKGLVRPFL